MPPDKPFKEVMPPPPEPQAVPVERTTPVGDRYMQELVELLPVILVKLRLEMVALPLIDKEEAEAKPDTVKLPLEESINLEEELIWKLRKSPLNPAEGLAAKRVPEAEPPIMV